MSDAVKPLPKTKPLVQWGLVIVLAIWVAIAALPNYFSGQWPWSATLPVPTMGELRALMTTPLNLSGWEVVAHQEVQLGGNKWSLAEYQAPGTTDAPGAITPGNNFAVLLRPQTAADKQPEVEWVDLQGTQRWQVNDLHTVRFALAGGNGSETVTARYLRGIDRTSTFAVMQWYAWPQGGHFAPGRWFWADQARQWQHRERLPWVAVSILLPIEPVGNIRNHTETMAAIAQAVQTSLRAAALAPA